MTTLFNDVSQLRARVRTRATSVGTILMMVLCTAFATTVIDASPAEAIPTVTESGTTAAPLQPAPAIELAKSGALAAGSIGAVGDTIDYTFTVTNSGNVTLHDVLINDPLPGLSALSFAWPSSAGILEPGQSVTATASYVLTQSDVDAASVFNIATASGTPPTGPALTPPGSAAVVDIPQNPAIDVVKSGALSSGSTGVVGDTVEFTFAATNEGNVTLHDVEIADVLPGLSVISYSWPGPDGVLAPGESVLAVATYALTQADTEAGSVVNTATVSGSSPIGAPVTGEDSTTVQIAPTPEITLVKAGTLGPGSTGIAGDTIHYAFTVTNTGNTTIVAVNVKDALPGLSSIEYEAWPGPEGVLAPGESVAAVAEYTVSGSDVSAGSVVNTAIVSGETLNGSSLSSTSNTVTIPLVRTPSPIPPISGELARTGASIHPSLQLAVFLIAFGLAVAALARYQGRRIGRRR